MGHCFDYLSSTTAERASHFANRTKRAANVQQLDETKNFERRRQNFEPQIVQWS